MLLRYEQLMIERAMNMLFEIFTEKNNPAQMW